jgi:DNA-binding transcriptional LysR family regulator
MQKSFSSKAPSIDFDLRQLEIFRSVVELGSFSKAAAAVSLAQASVSERIATLENMVGTKLLDRLGRQIVPTKAGELLYKHSVLMLEMKHTARLEIQEFLGIKAGNVHIGGSTIPGEYILPRVIRSFRDKHASITVSLTIASSRAIERRVLEGDLELGVIGSKSVHKNVICHKLWKDELVVAVPAQHRWAKRKGVTKKELFEEPFILRQTGSGTLNALEEYLQFSRSRDNDPQRVVAHFGTSTAVKEGIKAGLGISILSSRAVDTELKAGIIKTLKVNGIRMFRNFYLIRDRRRIASPLSQAMLDFLRTASQQYREG